MKLNFDNKFVDKFYIYWKQADFNMRALENEIERLQKSDKRLRDILETIKK